jgi:hypothetical protein
MISETELVVCINDKPIKGRGKIWKNIPIKPVLGKVYTIHTIIKIGDEYFAKLEEIVNIISDNFMGFEMEPAFEISRFSHIFSPPQPDEVMEFEEELEKELLEV